MSQSKRHSALETATNTATGFVGSYFITLTCFHLESQIATATLYATLGCTAWSLLRGYYLRRVFNHLHTKHLLAVAKAAAPEGYEVNLRSVPKGWAVPHWANPFEADFTPCPKDAEGYHEWYGAPITAETPCRLCGMKAGQRLTSDEVA